MFQPSILLNTWAFPSPPPLVPKRTWNGFSINLQKKLLHGAQIGLTLQVIACILN